jgi:Fe-S cluster assembly protein SufD
VAQGIPTRKTENYKYTNLQPAFSGEYQFVHQREVKDFHLDEIFKCDVPQLDTHLVTTRNGWYYAEVSPEGILPQSVILDSLDKIAGSKPELLQNIYGSLADTFDRSDGCAKYSLRTGWLFSSCT